jgi:hypothetical protein
MKRLFSIALVMILSSIMFFTVVYAGEKEVVKPTRGTWSGVTSFIVPNTCPAGSQKIQSMGKGVMTLTGASEWVGAPSCLDLSTGIASGTAVIIAANGDAIYLTTEIHFIFDLTGMAGTWLQDTEAYGGTGRFEGVGGMGSSSGEFHFTSPTEAVWAGTNEGELKF